MKLRIPDMKKKGNVNSTGEHGPDKPVVTDLPLIRTIAHSHTINPINADSYASSFGVKHADES